jgi:transposase
MSECKHGLRTGCSYCHAPASAPPPRQAGQPKRRGQRAALSEKMNDRMTALKKRLRQLRGE